MKLPYFLIDAFTDRAFTGNPAAVYVLKEPLSDDLMQKIAAEMNLSETAFVLRSRNATRLRWFTPTTEVDLCGHATLASAHALFTAIDQPRSGVITFDSASGALICKQTPVGIRLDFPATPPSPMPTDAIICEQLGVTDPIYFGQSKFDYLIHLPREEDVQALAPNFSALAGIATRGFIVTAEANAADLDFVSRFFAPATGVNEDPVTGSAHCCLGPYWATYLNKPALHAAQRSERGGNLAVEVVADRVLLTGRAVLVGRGELLL
jgi:PhzF family phenazine biosynthesis protein